MDTKSSSGLGNAAGSELPPGADSNRSVPAAPGQGSPASGSPASALLGSVSHELRSPLAVIKGYTATLLRYADTLDGAERRDFLDAIRVACEQLEAIVGQLLEMSQLESGALVPALIPLGVEYLVREAALAFEDRLKWVMPGAQVLSLQVAQDAPLPLVEADPRLLRDAVDILLENAVKYSPGGGAILVSMLTEHVAGVGARGGRRSGERPPANAVVIKVTDRGIGIPEEQLERIFDRFHRVDTRLTREVDGLGLGLAIAARIVELHGGVIWGESQLGVGSTFFIALPALAGDERLLLE